MSWLGRALANARALLSRRARLGSLDDEIETHLEMLTADLIRAGRPPDDARVEARRAFGGVTQTQEAYRDQRRWAIVGDLGRDFAIALRRAVREPRLLLAVTLTIGLGVGANAAIFDAADQLLFRPLALPHPEQVVAVYNVNRQTGKYLSSSLPDYDDFRQRLAPLQDLAAYMRLPLAWGGDHAERLGGEAVTPNFFETLQLAPVLGTTFQSHREAAGWPLVALIGENFWRARLGGDPAIVGRTIDLDGEPFTVIGVVPRSFGTENLGWSQRPAVWIPFDAVEVVEPDLRANGIFHQRAVRFALMIGRLRPGVTLPEAQSQADVVASTLATESPKTNAQVGVTIFPAGRVKFYPAYRATLTRSLEAFAAASIFIFVLACLNLVSLLAERLLAREREMAVRLSLGGSTARIARQLLAEGLVLSLPGFGLALLLAAAVQQAINRFPTVFGVGLALKFSMTSQVVESALALSLLMALLFAAVPAIGLGRLNVTARLKNDQRVMSGGRHGWVRALPAAAQVVVSAVLAAGALLVMRSVAQGEGADLGFDRSHLVSVVLESARRSRPADGHATAQAIGASLMAVPGVTSGTPVSVGLLSGISAAIAVGKLGDTPGIAAAELHVDAGFFDTTGIPLVRGRPFDRADTDSSEPAVVISERLARALSLDATQTEPRLALLEGSADPKTVRVVGVARDARVLRSMERRTADDLPRGLGALRIPAVYPREDVRDGGRSAAGDPRRRNSLADQHRHDVRGHGRRSGRSRAGSGTSGRGIPGRHGRLGDARRRHRSSWRAGAYGRVPATRDCDQNRRRRTAGVRLQPSPPTRGTARARRGGCRHVRLMGVHSAAGCAGEGCTGA